MSQPTGPQPPLGATRPPSLTPRKRKLARWIRQKTARRRMKQFAEAASQMLALALTIAAASAGDAGVPGLSSGLQALLEFLKKIRAMKTNVEGVETLATRITALKDALEKLLSQHEQLPDEMKELIDAVCRVWERIAADAQNVKCRGMIKKFFTSNVDAMKLQELIQVIDTSIQDFLSQSMNIEATVHVARQDVSVVRQNMGTVHRDVGTVRQDVKALKTHVELSLLSTYARRAHYSSSPVRRECLEGTRKDVLADAYSWIHESSEEVASCSKSGHLLWINGWAGTGKTAIACSIAKKYDDEGVLSANFFCSRTDAECRDPNRIFVTIARQLCQYHEPFKEKVMAALKRTPDVVHAKPLDQFKVLILQPLRELEGVFPTCVIVIDALDECDNTGLQSVILDILARHIRELAPFLFVVTSRPESHITAFFEKANEVSLKDSTQPPVLHNVHLELVLDDIRRYLIDGFREIRETFTIEADWPSNQDVDRLAEMSGGFFIFATTVLRCIGDPNFSDPKRQMQELLAASVSILYDLYCQVLALAYTNVDTLHKTNPSLSRVLGAITLAEEPLSAAALASLLGMSEGDVRNKLARLRSVIHLPEEGSVNTIRFIHPTFPEFLLDGSLDKPEAFHIIPVEHHLNLFMRSLVAMDSLKRNIAGIERSAAFRSEVPGLSDTVKRCIPTHVAYASCFWSIHLSRCASGTLGQGARNLLHGFLTRQMLYWLEACSLLRVLAGALTALESAENVCQDLGGSFTSLVALLADYHRFLWTYYYCIDAAPLQVYHSALAFAPTKSLVMKAYAQELGSSIIVRSGALSSWPPRRDSFTGHGGKIVFAITFSSSGDCFVTGGWDHKLKMWKTSTCTMVQSFDGHTDIVYCVAISPDGVHIASGSSDQDIYIWQVSSGECVLTLKGHTASVYSVAYSSDGRRLLSATHEGEAKLWDMADGRCILTLDKTGSYTWQVGLSPDGGVIARGSGASLSLYDIYSATDETIDCPSVVEACTFSPDGRLVAARSDHVIQIWQCEDKSLVHFIQVTEGLTSRLAFSRDGTRIAYGSRKGSVCLRRVASEDSPLVLPGHTGVVWDVSWSPDGLQVISSGDCDIYISYDVLRTAQSDRMDLRLAHVHGHGGQPIRSVAFSPDGSRIITGGEDNAVRLWSSICELQAILYGHRDWVCTVAYSPDGCHIATGSRDNIVKEWKHVDKSPACCDFPKDASASIRGCLWGYSADGHCIVSNVGGNNTGLPKSPDQSTFIVLPSRTPSWVSPSIGGTYVAYAINGSIHLEPVSRGSPDTEHPHLPRILPAVTTVALSSDGSTLAYASSTTIHICSLSANSCNKINTIRHPYHISFSRDGNTVACACDDGVVELWSIHSNKSEPRTFKGHVGRVNAVSWGPSDLQIVSVGQDGLINSWRTHGSGEDGSHVSAAFAPFAVFQRALSSGHSSFALRELPQEGSIQIVQLIDSIFLWDIVLQLGEERAAGVAAISAACRLSKHWEYLAGKQKFPWCPATVATSQSRDLLACPLRSAPNAIRVYDLHTRTERVTLQDEHSADIRLVEFSPDGWLLATSSDDNTIKVWNLRTSACDMRRTIQGCGVVQNIAFSPDGLRIVIGLDDRSLYIIDAHTGHTIHSLTLPLESAANVMFDLDNTHVLSQDREDRLYIWDTTAHQVAVIHESSMRDESWFHALQLMPDGTGVRIETDGHPAAIREIRLWERKQRIWPIYHIDPAGWVYAKTPEHTQRLCWLPRSWRIPLSFDGDVLCVYDSLERRVVGLKFSRPGG